MKNKEIVILKESKPKKKSTSKKRIFVDGEPVVVISKDSEEKAKIKVVQILKDK